MAQRNVKARIYAHDLPKPAITGGGATVAYHVQPPTRQDLTVGSPRIGGCFLYALARLLYVFGTKSSKQTICW